MKSIFKSAFAVFILLILALNMTATALGADSTVIYQGKAKGFDCAPGSKYTVTDLFENFKDVMPGDRLTERIVIKNKATDCDYIKLYVRAAAHDEEKNPPIYTDGDGDRCENAKTMADFLNQLQMKIYSGDELIYESSPDDPSYLTENRFISTLRRGQSTALTVELYVPIELGNEFSLRTGEVDLIFTAEAFSYPTDPPASNSQLTVRKVWDDGGYSERPDSVTVNLLKNGDFKESVKLSTDNQWTYTWSKLSKNDVWSVEEVSVPEGYTVSYETNGSVTTVTNTKIHDKGTEDIPEQPTYLTVKKEWSDDSALPTNRPESVGITLYSGKTAVETVWLGSWNDWSYTWNDLSGSGEWSILEIAPDGYTPSYSVSGNFVTVTNTATLIQTGQTNWPILVFGILGAAVLAFGCCILFKVNKNEST